MFTRKSLLAALGIALASVGSFQLAAAEPVRGASTTGLIDCSIGGAMPFALAALNQPRTAELGASSEAAALRNFLASHPTGQSLPRSGWVEVARKTVDANDYVRYANGSLTKFHSVLLFRVAGRAWQVHPSYPPQCNLRTMLSQTRPSTAWNIVPKRLPLNRRSRVVWIQMTELACASGRPADGRAHVPIIQYTRTKITLTATIEPQKSSSAQTCQNNPPTYVRVVLARRIGSRALVDGGSVPENSRLSRKQLKRIRQRRNKTSVLLFTRSQSEVCHDVADGALTIGGLKTNAKQRARLDVLESRCTS